MRRQVFKIPSCFWRSWFLAC